MIGDRGNRLFWLLGLPCGGGQLQLLASLMWNIYQMHVDVQVMTTPIPLRKPNKTVDGDMYWLICGSAKMAIDIWGTPFSSGWIFLMYMAERHW